MSAGCEAIALPAIFLTIVLLGGVRVSDITVLVAPSVFTLVLGVLLVRVLVQCGALAPDRLRLLRSLAVTFGSAFVLKFVVLYELSAPGTGWLKRVLQAMLEGMTLGTLTQQVPHPATGYLAFVTLALFLFAIFLLPHRDLPRLSLRPSELVPADPRDIERAAPRS